MKETGQFKSDKKRIKGAGRYDWKKLRNVVRELMNDRPLMVKHCDHALSGDCKDVRECHVEPDWLLIYDKTGDAINGELRLIRTGSHSALF